MYLATTKVLTVTVQVKNQVALFANYSNQIFSPIKILYKTHSRLNASSQWSSITIVIFTVLFAYVIVLDVFYLT